MITVKMDGDVEAAVAIPTKIYSGFQVLIHSNLVNADDSIVIEMRNLGLIILKVMIALLLVCDVAIIFICLREWRRKKSAKIFLRLRGMLSIGYVLTTFAIYRFAPVCVDHPKVEDFYSVKGRSYAVYHQQELEDNILFSIGVVILFIITWFAFQLTSKKGGNNEDEEKKIRE